MKKLFLPPHYLDTTFNLTLVENEINSLTLLSRSEKKALVIIQNYAKEYEQWWQQTIEKDLFSEVSCFKSLSQKIEKFLRDSKSRRKLLYTISEFEILMQHLSLNSYEKLLQQTNQLIANILNYQLQWHYLTVHEKIIRKLFNANLLISKKVIDNMDKRLTQEIPKRKIQRKETFSNLLLNYNKSITEIINEVPNTITKKNLKLATGIIVGLLLGMAIGSGLGVACAAGACLIAHSALLTYSIFMTSGAIFGSGVGAQYALNHHTSLQKQTKKKVFEAYEIINRNYISH